MTFYFQDYSGSQTCSFGNTWKWIFSIDVIFTIFLFSIIFFSQEILIKLDFSRTMTRLIMVWTTMASSSSPAGIEVEQDSHSVITLRILNTAVLMASSPAISMSTSTAVVWREAGWATATLRGQDSSLWPRQTTL